MVAEQLQNVNTPKTNETGIPDNLKQKVEDASGLSLDDVRVHYHSDEPKKIKARAYTQGSEIYIAPGQEKCLEHELQHVVQQKEGRVKPTTTENGKVINDSPALEDEASRPIQGTGDSSAPKENVALSGEQPIQMMKAEKDSIFEIQTIKEQIKTLIEEINLDKTQKGWPTQVPDDNTLTQYAIRVQELLEDIRQVDLQFLAATALSYEDDTREPAKTTKNALTKEDEDLFTIPVGKPETEDDKEKREKKQEKLREEQEKNKGILLEKLAYLKGIKEKVQSQFETNKSKYDLAKSNLTRARKEKLINSLTKTMNKSEQKYKSAEKYLSDVNEQISLLETTLKNSDQKGYVFNQSTLLTKIDGKIKLYMAIVAPSKERKDIKETDDPLSTSGKTLGTSGAMHQWGVSTPVRAFSWLTKYLMDKTAVSNTAPVIRTLSAKPDAIKVLQQNAVSESFKGTKSTGPQNEDFKVPDQYGMAPGSEAFNKLIASKPELQSVAEEDIMPDDLLEGAGHIQSYDDFKMNIGFSRMKDDKTQATDVHFFDKEHTAFHEVKTDDTPSLYSPKAAKENYETYNKKMDGFIHLLGKQTYVKNAEEKNLIGQKPSDAVAVRAELKVLLEANHCIPSGAENDLYGNSISAQKSEQDFALKHISGADKTLLSLINLTELRYQKIFNTLSDSTYSKQDFKKVKKQRESKEKSLVDSIGLKLEIELLADSLKEVSVKDLFKDPKSVGDYFNGLRALDKTDPEIKLRVTAFCFKLLRTIMDAIPSNSTNIHPDEEHDQTEGNLFSKRESGDYFDVLNRKEHKIIPANANDPTSKEMLVPYDKLTSKGRFKPAGDATKKEQIPFVGGASGTTRDMTRDLMEQGIKDTNTKNKWLKTEKDYWDFQLMNAAFMITYDYHSFVEVLFRAATTRLEYNPNENVSQKIYDYLKLIADDTIKDVTNKTIIGAIKKIIERGIKK
ncbi:DUF4157 domain-containing protein [Fusibacter sp. 3D3]|uniref:eCIS core domain-containing protein n=1 Tax=Fusibacter sp. 3D3 TaxID=1048380 RepID=UPI0008529DE3|nr:DUF4157 domain-containing protein [Fusibacter sp. 3D3]GAU77516.1 hypothetical protein F3D3_2145 [Fusibacter sp. 3D3]